MRTATSVVSPLNMNRMNSARRRSPKDDRHPEQCDRRERQKEYAEGSAKSAVTYPNGSLQGIVCGCPDRMGQRQPDRNQLRADAKWNGYQHPAQLCRRAQEVLPIRLARAHRCRQQALACSDHSKLGGEFGIGRLKDGGGNEREEEAK